jgi:Tfp pilus assembly protein PilF
MTELSNLKTGVNGSMKVLESEGLPAAVKLLDAAIEEAVRQGWTRSVQTLCCHAAVLCQFAENLPLRRHYYELSLFHSPANYRALYGLAKVCLEEGQTAPAKLYAKQSYEVLMASHDPLAHTLLDLIELSWQR